MTSLLATDNVNAGRIAADALAVAITKSYADTEGDVAMIGSKPGVASIDQRSEGFRDVLAAKYRALAIVADKFADGDRARIRQIMKDVIAGDDDLRGVFVSDPMAALAVAQVVSEKTTGDLINIVAVGSDDKLVELLQAGLIAGIVVEDPFRMGYDGVKTALAASKGEEVSAHIDTGAMLLTKANVGSVQAHELPELRGQVIEGGAVTNSGSRRRARDCRSSRCDDIFSSAASRRRRGRPRCDEHCHRRPRRRRSAQQFETVGQEIYKRRHRAESPAGRNSVRRERSSQFSASANRMPIKPRGTFRIQQIAFSIGFRTQSHFSTVFKRLVGWSPYRWRDANKRETSVSENACGVDTAAI